MSPGEPVSTCRCCGAHLSLDQLRGTDCPYCKMAFSHHARAVEHAALVQRVMAQNIAATTPWLAPPPGYGFTDFAPPYPQNAPFVPFPTAHVQRAIALVVGLSMAMAVIGIVLSIVLLR